MLPSDEVETLAETFRMLGDPNRLRIVLSCLDAPSSVGEIVDRVGLSQTLVRYDRVLKRMRRKKMEEISTSKKIWRTSLYVKGYMIAPVSINFPIPIELHRTLLL